MIKAYMGFFIKNIKDYLFLVCLIYLIYKYRVCMGGILITTIVVYWLYFFLLLTCYFIFGCELFLVMRRPIISANPMDNIYYYISIYLYNLQYERLYLLINFLLLSKNPFASMNIKQRMFICIRLFITIIFYILIDCGKLLFDLLILFCKALLQVKRRPAISALREINKLIESSYSFKPKTKVIHFLNHVGMRINPNKQEFTRKTISFFEKCLISYSPTQIYNSLNKDITSDNFKNTKIEQYHIETEIFDNPSKTRGHSALLLPSGCGIITATNPPKGLNYKYLDVNIYGKDVYGHPCSLQGNRGNNITEEVNKITNKQAIIYVKKVFFNPEKTIDFIEISGNKSELKTTTRIVFEKQSKLSDFLINEPYFSDKEISLLKSCGKYNDYFI